ncbi:MAG: hypothetical protein WCC57_19545 [Paracoccaceae bacterium]
MQTLLTFFMASMVGALYFSAAVVLKYAAQLPPWGAVVAAVALLALACLIEVEVLRRARFGEMVILTIAFEVTLTVVFSRLALAEAFSPRDMAGIALLGLGLVLLLLGGEHAPNATQTVALVSADSERMG